METKISPYWSTTAIVVALLGAAVALALTGHTEHVDALITGALGCAIPLRARVSP